MVTSANRRLVAICLLGSAVGAAEAVKSCPDVDVQSVQVLTGSSRTERIGIVQVPATANGEEAVTLVASGPVLGSMDSKQVHTELVCLPKGVAVTATLTRSAEYRGATTKNVLWEPRIEIVAVVRQPEVTFSATWKMRMSNGNELSHSRTPPYPEHEYPIVVTKIISAR